MRAQNTFEKTMYPKLTNRNDILKMLDEMIEARANILDSCSKLTTEQLNDPVLACAAPQLKLPAEISERCTLLEVKSRSRWGSFVDESFKLGDYAVGDVDRDGGASSSSTSGSASQQRQSSSGSYSLTDGKSKLRGKCNSKEQVDTVKLFKQLRTQSENGSTKCECQGNDQKASMLLAGDGRRFEGTLQTGKASYAVSSLDLDFIVEGIPAGLRVDGDGAVGALDFMFPGKVWLDPALDDGERRQIACLLAGVLLYPLPLQD